MSTEFSIFIKSQEEWNDVTKWGGKNNYNIPLWGSGEYFSNFPYLHFVDGNILTHNLAGNINYTFEEFKNKYMNKQTFEVEEQFILDAHKAADDNWREKIEQKFPELFRKFTVADVGSRFRHRAGDEYILSRIGGLYALISLKSGVCYSGPVKDIEQVANNMDKYFTKIS